MPPCESTTNTISQENRKTTIVLIAVAMVESVFLIPHFASIEVKDANTAESIANNTHIIAPP
jgi:PBP1b-binding outer membrane lipoprotein LpoB